ncbi:uncharacterized protein LOC143032596 [Oratosquilla oratoria]|uniref:uncharacterized protein LOC143032596 n=1 Tax=Oratosquilla oratoria TaxID=337810 RepID=UPI003F763D2C
MATPGAVTIQTDTKRQEREHLTNHLNTRKASGHADDGQRGERDKTTLDIFFFIPGQVLASGDPLSLANIQEQRSPDDVACLRLNQMWKLAATMTRVELLIVVAFFGSAVTADSTFLDAWSMMGRRPHLTQIWQKPEVLRDPSSPSLSPSPSLVSVLAPVRIRADSLQLLPCPDGEGYYAYPTNCSMFYRCVDYEGSNTMFSRYAFLCPNNTVFLEGKDTCVPGRCEMSLIDPSRPPTNPVDPKFPVEVATPATTTSSPSPVTTLETSPTSPETPDLDPVEVIVTSVPPPVDPIEVTGLPDDGGSIDEVTMPLIPPTEVPVGTEVPGAETGSSVPAEGDISSGSEVEATNQTCDGSTYVQHEKYCNLYYPCNDPLTQYACPGGTVFDQERSMCRISAAGKHIPIYLVYLVVFYGKGELCSW